MFSYHFFLALSLSSYHFLPPDDGRGNAGSSFENSDEDFIACMVFIFKIKRTSGNNGFHPFSSGQLPTFFGNSRISSVTSICSL